MASLAPAATACFHVASTSGTYSTTAAGHGRAGDGSSIVMPGRTSFTNRRESPNCTSACTILPPGPSVRRTSFPPNAFS